MWRHSSVARHRDPERDPLSPPPPPRPGRAAPAWTKRTPGHTLTVAALVLFAIIVGLSADRGSSWFQASPAPSGNPPSEPAGSGGTSSPGPVVTLTVGPEQRPTPTASAAPRPAPVGTSPTRPPRADRGTPVRPSPTCRVTLVRSAAWEQGYIATVTLVNRGSRPVFGWTVQWRFRGDQRVTNLWNGKLAQDGRAVTVRDDDWNATIGPGESVSFGFEATAAPRSADPDRFTLNGVTCR